ncbi:hypothetical protein ACFLSQ_00325 [Bacteroidota bacterium]
MKNICRILIILNTFLTIIYSTYSLDINDCLTLVYPHEGSAYNPDSVMVDTCSQSPTFGKWYSKRGYVFGMKIYIFGDEALRRDSTVTWEDIDSTFTQIKNGFHSLEQQFGTYIILRSPEWGSWLDSLFLEYPVFEIEFDNYFEFDSVSKAISNIDSCGKVFLKHVPKIYSIVSKTNENFNLPFKIFRNNYNLLVIVNDMKLSKNSNIIIFNLLGSPVLELPIYNNNEILIDVSTWAKGVYIINLGNYSKIIII